MTTEPCIHQSLQDLSKPHVTTEPFTHQILLECNDHEQIRGLLDRSPRDDGADFFDCSRFNREQLGSGHSKNDTLHQPLYSQHTNLHCTSPNPTYNPTNCVMEASEGLTKEGCTRKGKATVRRSICPTFTETQTRQRTYRLRAEMSGRGQERVFEFLPFGSLLSNCFPTDVDCVYIFFTGVNPVGVFEILVPSPACKSCWVYTSPFVTVHFPVLLFLTPPAEVTTVQYFRYRMRFLKSCEVTSQSVFLDEKGIHGGSVVLFHALMAHSVYSHPERANVFIWSSSESKHAGVESCTPGG